MTQGIASSMQLTLMRLNSIESNFTALQGISDKLNAVENTNVSNVENKDFKTILDEKLSKDNKEVKNLPELDKETISDVVEPEKKEALNLKSKIDLKAQMTDIDEIVDTFSSKYNIDGDFIKAIIKQESGFNPNATSKKGAMGLMQLMPATAKSLGVINAYNPWENVEGGVKYLKGLMDRFNNDEKLALAAYNAGPNAVKKYGGIPPYKETQNYVNSIMSAYNKIKEAKL